ncbi:MAG: Ig-like domain-containing protein [Clostridiales Family XIII bacterium]|jgi:uncharacterized protein YjdB|nr:Ig-like domain-containing protein [Clostridiales Family XIII bacterium]
MRQTNSYRNKRKLIHKVIALVVCASLVAAAVFISVVATTSTSFAVPTDEPDSELMDVTGETDDEANADDGDNSDNSDNGDDGEPSEPVSIEITKYQRDMKVGDESTISYKVRNAGEGDEVAWESSDDSIAKVDSKGTVRAIAAGKAEIAASIGDARASVLISVEDPVINPTSFKISIDELTAADMLLDAYEMKVGDELHMSARIEPVDATINGKFEWRVSDDEIATIKTTGEIDEVAVLKAEKDGDVTVTVRYVDEGGDDSVKLDDYKLKIRVSEKKSLLSPMLIGIFAAIVAAVVVIIVVIARNGKRRRAEEERRERTARGHRDEAMRERARQEARAKLMREGYERGYRDSEAEQFERITRVYDAPVAPPEPYRPEDDGEPEKPFSEDDIR